MRRINWLASAFCCYLYPHRATRRAVVGRVVAARAAPLRVEEPPQAPPEAVLVPVWDLPPQIQVPLLLRTKCSRIPQHPERRRLAEAYPLGSGPIRVPPGLCQTAPIRRPL
jgi:hypothetical protein